VNTAQLNRFSVSFHSCNENIPLTIQSSILPQDSHIPRFPSALPLPPAWRYSRTLFSYRYHYTLNVWIFQSISSNTNKNTCAYTYFNVIVIRDSLWFQVTVSPECCAASVCEWCTKFPLRISQLRVLETSDINHPMTRSHIHEIQRPQLHHCDRPKTRNLLLILLIWWNTLLIHLRNVYNLTVSPFQITGTNAVGPVCFIVAAFLDFISLQIVLAGARGRAVFGRSSAEIVGSNPIGAWMFVCCECLCYQLEVSATSWSLVQRSPTDCGASLCVIKKPRKRGG
jgi:hypothetical protein